MVICEGSQDDEVAADPRAYAPGISLTRFECSQARRSAEFCIRFEDGDYGVCGEIRSMAGCRQKTSQMV